MGALLSRGTLLGGILAFDRCMEKSSRRVSVSL